MVWCGRGWDILTRGRESERESKETHTPAPFFYFTCYYFAFFRLLFFSLLSSLNLVSFVFACLVRLFSLSLHLQGCFLFVSLCLLYVDLVYCVLLYTCVYVCSVVVFYLCCLGYWLNNIFGLLSALKLFFGLLIGLSYSDIVPTFAKLV